MESQSSRHATLLNSDYGKSSKELIEFVGQLRALGYVYFLLIASIFFSLDEFPWWPSSVPPPTPLRWIH